MAEEYIPNIKPELKISIKNEDELKDVKPFKQVHISRDDESKIEDVLHQKPISVKRESDKLYNQDHLPTTLTKHKRYNPDSYSDIIVGFKDPRPKFWQSVPVEVEINIPKNTTHKDLMLANEDKNNGISNPINQAITQYETKADLDDIKEAEKIVDLVVDEGLNNILEQLQNSRQSKYNYAETKIKTDKNKNQFLNNVEKDYNKGHSEMHNTATDERKALKANIKPVIEDIQKVKEKEKKAKAAEKINKVAVNYNTRFKVKQEEIKKIKEEADNNAKKEKAAEKINKIVTGHRTRSKVKEELLKEEQIKQMKDDEIKKTKEAYLKKVEDDLITAKQKQQDKAIEKTSKKAQKEAEAIRRKEIIEEISNPNIGSNEKRPLIEQGLKLIETGDKTKTEEIRKLISKAGLGDQLRNTKNFEKLKAILDEGYKKLKK